MFVLFIRLETFNLFCGIFNYTFKVALYNLEFRIIPIYPTRAFVQPLTSSSVLQGLFFICKDKQNTNMKTRLKKYNDSDLIQGRQKHKHTNMT